RDDNVADPGRAVEHRVLGVQVEMDERLRHRGYSALFSTPLFPQPCGRRCGQITRVSFRVTTLRPPTSRPQSTPLARAPWSHSATMPGRERRAGAPTSPGA